MNLEVLQDLLFCCILINLDVGCFHLVCNIGTDRKDGQNSERKAEVLLVIIKLCWMISLMFEFVDGTETGLLCCLLFTIYDFGENLVSGGSYLYS